MPASCPRPPSTTLMTEAARVLASTRQSKPKASRATELPTKVRRELYACLFSSTAYRIPEGVWQRPMAKPVATPIMQVVSVKMMVVGAGSGCIPSKSTTTESSTRELLGEEARYESTVVSTSSHNASNRQPITPPVKMSAGLCTPRYTRLNMTRNDHRPMAVNRKASVAGPRVVLEWMKENQMYHGTLTLRTA